MAVSSNTRIRTGHDKKPKHRGGGVSVSEFRKASPGLIGGGRNKGKNLAGTTPKRRGNKERQEQPPSTETSAGLLAACDRHNELIVALKQFG
eukprot:379433-Amphidinium_carterae.2